MCDATNARAFWADEPDAADPFALKDLSIAIERILRAIGNGESIAIYGDYDCDGVTACALLWEVLSALHANVRIYIPDRFEEGYGLNAGALDKLKDAGVSLVITVDCGTRAISEAEHARVLGLDLVVTDHHEVADGVLPGAYAVVNPRRADCAYPFKTLAGVGVAFRLAQGLLRAARQVTAVPCDEQALLDLVAIGTIADVAPLLGENRQLVREGLRRINTQPRTGVRYLASAARARLGSITAQTIGFILAPRLNAAGRIDTARDAFQLLTTADESLASQIALRLNERNEQRQKLTAEVARHAERAAFTHADADVDGANIPLLFAVSETYNAGVIGLAAARLVERFYKPAIVVAVHIGEARGSCRSIDGFNITAALDECKGLLARHGGHAAAAGFTTPAESLDELRQRLLGLARVQQPAGGWLRALHIDAEINLFKLSWDSYTQLERLEPHGMANPRPMFVTRAAVVHSIRRVGKSQSQPDQAPHLQLRLKDARGAIWDAIGWRMGERAGELSMGAKIDVAFQLDINEWNGERKLQLVVQDFRMTDD